MKGNRTKSMIAKASVLAFALVGMLASCSYGSSSEGSSMAGEKVNPTDSVADRDDGLLRVDVSKAENGTIEVSSDRVRKGESVTVTYIPSKGYSLSRTTVNGIITDVSGECGQDRVEVIENVEEDISVEASFEPDEYVVNLFAPVKGKPFYSMRVKYGSNISLPTAQADTPGYTLGWRDSDGNEYYDGQTWSIARNITLYAQWLAGTYMVTLNPNGGSLGEGVSSTLQVTSGEPYSLPTPTRDGYTFGGWKAGDVSVELDGDDWTWSSENVELVAQWTAESYVIMLDANGGEVDVQEKGVTYDGEYELPEPTRKGYSFQGWYLGDKRVEPNGTWTYSTSNATLKSAWKADEYEIALDSNYDGAAGSVAKVSCNGEYSIDYVPARTGYRFTGWQLQDGTSVPASGDSWTYSKENTTLKAQWDAVDVEVTLDLDGGEGVESSVTVKYDSAYDLGTPTKDGYKFTGWKLANGTGVEKSGDKWTTSTQAITLKATWSAESYKVTLNAQGGKMEIDGEKKDSVEKGVTYGVGYELPTPTKTGYTFAGWYTSLVNGTQVASEGTSWAYPSDMTLYARYTQNEYTVTLDANGGSLSKSTYDVRYNEKYSLPTPTRSGYTFQGWSTSKSGGSQFAQNGTWEDTEGKKLYAMWSNTTYVLTFYDNSGVSGKEKLLVTYGDTYSISSNYDSTKKGYSFSGWYTSNVDQTDGNKFSTSGDWTYSKNVTLYAKWNLNASSLSVGDSFEFGKYPQTDVTSTLGTELNKLATGKWESYDYYYNSSISDFMMWQDVTYNETTYRGVKIKDYQRPNSTNIEANSPFQKENGYITGNTYWFRYEPIKWTVKTKSSDSVTILSNVILDSQQYFHIFSQDGEKTYRASYDGMSAYATDNNYKYSDIRGWLNTSFYNWAFSSTEKSSIIKGLVKNGAATVINGEDNNYYCEDTYDYCFLPSYSDINQYISNGENIQKNVTGYAKCQGIALANSSNDPWYWTRSPYGVKNFSNNGYGVSTVKNGGFISANNISSTFGGIVPALVLKIS